MIPKRALQISPAYSIRPHAAAIACVLVFAGAAGCAAAVPSSALSPEQASRVGQICRSTLGVEPGEAHYAGCVESLSASLNDLGRGRALARARGDCIDRGMGPGTPALAECVLRGSGAAVVSARTVRQASETGAPKSYFYTSPREVYRREQLSCARLGLDPTSRAFGGCVASLRSALFAADNPMN
jgi:hypothetical protein